MESANLHHQLQENLSHLRSSSSSSSQAAVTSYYGVGIEHAWTHQQANTTTASNLSNPSNSLNLHNGSSSYINLMPDLGFHGSWPLITENLTRSGSNSSTKEELSSSSTDSTFPKFTQMLTSPSSINLDHHHQQFYSSNNNPVQIFPQLMPRRSGGEYFSKIYPSINISNLNQQASPTSSCNSLEMNMQAMDLLASSRFSTTHHQPSNSSHEITEMKRPAGSLIEPKGTQAAVSKKSRLESRTSCPPLNKIRKEKLGDRISTLQQLVAPFGKTDTASVLMEAIGYINFLHNQIETLSVPFMKSSHSRHNKASQALLQPGMMEMNGLNGDHERKRDLRSRGLCLVPLSSVADGADAAAAASCVTGSPNFWSAGHNYGLGGT